MLRFVLLLLFLSGAAHPSPFIEAAKKSPVLRSGKKAPAEVEAEEPGCREWVVKGIVNGFVVLKKKDGDVLKVVRDGSVFDGCAVRYPDIIPVRKEGGGEKK